ncbi:MAG: glycogen/starch synthase [Chloroflexota bacterium]
MKILFVAAEMSPLAKVGGLADVTGSLPQALIGLGHDVRVMIPQYGTIDFSRYPLTPVEGKFKVPIMGNNELANLNLTMIKDKVPVYTIENQKYFGGDKVYGENDLERFLFFSRAVFEILPELEWQPEIVHCHDWHTALAVMWLKRHLNLKKVVFTIHNLAYQGAFDEAFLVKSELKSCWMDSRSGALEPPLNFLSQGILWADLVTTVSKTYSQEILTPQYGEGLDALLRLRYRQRDFVGIVNGIDYEEYNPETDPHIEANYNSKTVEKRIVNKLALQKRAGLPQDAGIPLFGMVQRLDEQKGLDLLEKAAELLLADSHVQLVVLGKGREHYEDMLSHIATRYPQKVALFAAFDNSLAHLIYAACDLFLMPSRFEPCGLGQLIAMRYGALPLVRHTGGLVDTVPEFTPNLEKGNGFVFREYTPEALATAFKQGVKAFNNQEAWHQVIRRVMKLDFSWRASARKYETFYASRFWDTSQAKKE